MPATNILITGSTGNVGYKTLKAVLANSDIQRGNYRVRAACYRKSNKIDNVRALNDVDAVYEVDASSCDQSLCRAFENIDYAMIVPSSSPDRCTHVCNYLTAAKKARVKYVVLLSIIRADVEHGSRFSKEFAEMEECVEKIASETDMKYSFIRTGLLNETLFLFAPDLRKGVLPLPLKDGRVAPVDSHDIGKFAAQLFLNPDRHSSRAFHVTGPQLVTGNEIAQIASQALGRRITYVNVSQSNCKRLLLDSGVDEWIADGFNGLFDEIAKGHFNFETSSLLRQFIQTEPTTLYQFFTEHAVRFTEEKGEEMERVEPPPAVVELKKKGEERKEERRGGEERKEERYERAEPGAKESRAHAIQSANNLLKQIRTSLSEVVEALAMLETTD